MKIRRSLSVGLAVTGLMAAGASAASAAPATFSPNGAVNAAETQPLVLKAGTVPTPARTYTCQPANITQQTASTQTTLGVGYFNIHIQAICTSGTGSTGVVTLDTSGSGFAGTNTGGIYSLTKNLTMTVNVLAGIPIYSAPNNGLPGTSTVGWTQGTSAVDPSVLTFSNTTIGVASTAASGILGQPITLTGSIQASPSAGGVLTLS